MQRMTGLITLLFALVFFSAAASAEDFGAVGSITRFEIYTPSADTYLQFHGRMYVKNSNGDLDEYRWGGTSCGTKVLTEAHVAALQAAQNNKKMMIEPLTQDGQGSAKCVVGFRLVEKKYLKLFP